MTLAFLTFPLLFAFILIAKPLFVALYTEKWLPAVPYFQVLCIAGLGECLQSVNFQTISAIGKSKITFKWTMIKRFMGMGLIVGGLALWGMKGILLGTVINAWFAYLVNMVLVSKYVGYKWWRQLLDLSPIIITSIVAALLSYVTAHSLHLSLYLDGIVKLSLFLFIYLGWSLFFKPEAFVYCKTIVQPLLSKLKISH